MLCQRDFAQYCMIETLQFSIEQAYPCHKYSQERHDLVVCKLGPAVSLQFRFVY